MSRLISDNLRIANKRFGFAILFLTLTKS